MTSLSQIQINHPVQNVDLTGQALSPSSRNGSPSRSKDKTFRAVFEFPVVEKEYKKMAERRADRGMSKIRMENFIPEPPVTSVPFRHELIR